MGTVYKEVTVTQSANIITWNYYFTVSPSVLTFASGGETKYVTVSSYRKKAINGVETTTREDVSWTVITRSFGFHTLRDKVSADPNPANGSRTGTATYLQEGSNKTVTIDLAQAAPKINTLTLKLSASGMSLVTLYVFRITPQTQGAPNSPSTYPAPFFSGTGTQAQFQWNNNQGLEVLDPDTGYKVFAHAGDSLNIVVKNRQNDTWANFMVIILQDNNQTIQAPI